MKARRLILTLGCILLNAAVFAQQNPCMAKLVKAETAFTNKKYGEVIHLLTDCANNNGFSNKKDKIRAWEVLSMAHFLYRYQPETANEYINKHLQN